MITRGSKYFYGAATFGFLAAVLYGIVTSAADQGGIILVMTGGGGIVDSVLGPITMGWKGGVGEHIGYSVLMGFAGIMAVLGGFHSAFRDGDAEAVAEVTHTVGSPAISTPFGLSYWPLMTAFSSVILLVGLAVSSALFFIGALGLIVCAFEWTVRSWSERATGDPELNREIRNKFMAPVEVPVGAVLGIGLIVFSVSRILLAVSKVGSSIVIIVLAIAMFVAALVLANRPHLKRSMLIGVGVLFGLIIIGGGIAGGVAGSRTIEEHSEKGEKAVAEIRQGDSEAVSLGGDTESGQVTGDNEVERG